MYNKIYQDWYEGWDVNWDWKGPTFTVEVNKQEGLIGCGTLASPLTAEEQESQSHTSISIPRFSARKRCPRNSHLWKPVGNVTGRDRGLLKYQASILKGTCMNLFANGLTHTELQLYGSSSKSYRNIQGGSKFSGFREIAREAAFSPRQKCW